jgi:hypothetical protein
MSKVYQVTDGGGESVWAVAASEEEARKSYLEYMDPDPEETLEFRILPDEEPLTIMDDDTGEKVTKTAAEWAAETSDNGEGTGVICASIW